MEGASPAIQPLPHDLEQQLNGDRDRQRLPAKLAFVDLETTGLDPQQHQVWEIAVILGDDERSWILDVDLERASGDALRTNGFYERHPKVAEPEELYEPPDARVVATEVARLTAGAHLVGVNPAFDATFLGAFIRAHGQVPTWHYHLVDVLPLIAGRYRIPPPWESKELSKAIGVTVPFAGERHTALGDAVWAKLMYEAVMSVGDE